MAEGQISEIRRGASPRGGGPDLGLALTGGGARAAYQVGVLSWIAKHYPDLELPIITGVSAGAVSAGHLAAHHGSFDQAVKELVALWTELTTQEVFRVDAASLTANTLRWGFRLLSGGLVKPPGVRALLDTAPLRQHLSEVYACVEGRLTGIDYNLHHRQTLRAVAISTTNYSTGQSVVWVQGRDIEPWIRPKRVARETAITVDHIMASTALPLFFPAVRIGEDWYGDGGIRQTAPLSPALHLGARRVLAISTRYGSTQAENDLSKTVGYPPPAQVMGVLMNSIFLDLIDQDELRIERLNRLLLRLPADQRDDLDPVRLLVIRPSRDLASLAGQYEPRLPGTFRFMVRGLGSQETASPDMLSMLMFQENYLSALVELGEHDAEARADELHEFLTERERGEDVEESARLHAPPLPEAAPEAESAAARQPRKNVS